MPATLARSLAMALFAVLYLIALEQSQAHARVLSYSRTFAKREVPQEHSHDFITDVVRQSFALDTSGIAAAGQTADPIFGLLGQAAAGKNAIDGKAECLQQRTADRAITNVKAKQNGDKTLIAAAVKYRALERNSGAVGQVTPPCTETPKNAELLGISQHQDPASPNAAAVNKAVELAVAKRLAELGQNPVDAKQTATFAPGRIGDPTARGLTCDDASCILQDNRLVPIASDAELKAAASGAGAGASNGSGNTPPPASLTGTTCPPDATVTVTVTVTAGQATPTAAPPASNNNSNNNNGGNLNPFTGALFGVPVTPLTRSQDPQRQFEVAGDTFVNFGAACDRSCARQNNACSNKANSSGNGGSGVGQCNQQESQCNQICRAAQTN